MDDPRIQTTTGDSAIALSWRQRVQQSTNRTCFLYRILRLQDVATVYFRSSMQR